jgi:uncharacterized tellurite resistance protein B-like protein
MIDFIKKYFGASADSDTDAAASSNHDIRIATCALFLEMANLDDEFSGTEKADVLRLMREHYHLSSEHAEEWTDLAKQQLDGSIDLWRFTNLINENYSHDEKMQIVELIWRLIFADGHLSEHENYLVRKLGKMLRLTHRELINCKLAVLHGDSDRVE